MTARQLAAWRSQGLEPVLVLLGDRAGEASLGEDLLQTLVEGGVGALQKLASPRVEEGGVEVPVYADDRVGHPVEYGLAARLLVAVEPRRARPGGP